jgi:hypothetical protein
MGPLTEKGTTMGHSFRFKVLWTIWMAGGGIAVAAVVYAITDSIGWTIAGLLASGVVLNAIGQVVTQPIQAARSAQRPPRPRPT